MTTQREPGAGAHIDWKHRDGPLLVCADGTLHWLTWPERIQFWLGLTNLVRLNDKFGAKRPCGICGRLVSWGSLGPREYHDCKPVPRSELDAAQAEIQRLTEKLGQAEEQSGRFLREWCLQKTELDKAERLIEQLRLQDEGYIGKGPDGIRMGLDVEEDHSATLNIVRWVGEGAERHIEVWELLPEEALRLILLGVESDRLMNPKDQKEE